MRSPLTDPRWDGWPAVTKWTANGGAICFRTSTWRCGRAWIDSTARCSLRTWTYRVAHNLAISKVIRRRTRMPTLVGVDELELRAESGDREDQLDRARASARLLAVIHELKPLDRQVMLLYLEDLEALEIAEVTGMSAVNVATKVHRIKKVLAARFSREHPMAGENPGGDVKALWQRQQEEPQDVAVASVRRRAVTIEAAARRRSLVFRLSIVNNVAICAVLAWLRPETRPFVAVFFLAVSLAQIER